MKQKNYQSGFSLMEIIVVIFIIVLGLIGVLSLVVQNIQVKDFNQNTLVASQLAQEGLELTRNIRDGNWLASNWFGTGLVIEGDSDTITIYFDSDNIIIIDNDEVNINEDEAILKKDNKGFYTHSVGDDTIFRRVVELKNDNTENLAMIKVSSIVQWSNRGKTHQYQADTIFYDWR